MSESMSYQQAGVDIDAGNELVERIKTITRPNKRPEMLGNIGGFGALFEVPTDRYQRPVLVSATDGVGTKLRLALDAKRYHTIGIDLVAMSVNDLIVLGAEPRYFLDYYACGKLSVDTAAAVIEGIQEGCNQAGCALVGGETAEMPGFYANDDFDLAGFAVGVVEKSAIVDGRRAEAGDTLIAIASSGPHANGYSLIRAILDKHAVDLQQDFEGRTLEEALLAPTRIYADSLLSLHNAGILFAAAHITGGGLVENLPRVLPKGVKAVIDTNSWEIPAVFRFLQETGQVPWPEMLRTFNCGIGMVACVPTDKVEEALSLLKHNGETAWVLGQLADHDGPAIVDMQ